MAVSFGRESLGLFLALSGDHWWDDLTGVTSDLHCERAPPDVEVVAALLHPWPLNPAPDLPAQLPNYSPSSPPR